ncbi:MAG: hypothetical protein ACR2O8_07420 [Rhizobiaceae bacterium]
MMLSVRHMVGLVISAVLAALLYWIWEDGLGLVQRQLRGYPIVRSSWGEFGPLIMLLFACLVLGLAQWIWDKIPSGDDSGK